MNNQMHLPESDITLDGLRQLKNEMSVSKLLSDQERKTISLTLNALILLEAIKKANVWEENAIDILFPPVKDYAQNKIAYWQRSANLYRQPINDVKINDEWMNFKPTIEVSYSDQTSQAIKELRDAKLVESCNAGMNTYYYKYIGL